MKTDDRIHYVLEYVGTNVAPGLATADAVAECPIGWRVESVELGDWFREVERIGYDVRTVTTWRATVRVTAVKEGE